MKIAIFWNYLFHYRVPFYNRLAQVPGVELTVFHGGEDPNRRGKSAGSAEPPSFESIQIATHEKSIHGAVVYFQTGMWKYLCTRKFDVIVCEGNFGILSNALLALYSRLTGARFLLWVGGWERKMIRGLAAHLRRVYIRIACRFTDGFLCYGSNAVQFLARYGAVGSCTVIQNTVDTERIQAASAHHRSEAAKSRKALGLENKTVVLTVGAQIARKKTALLIDAYRIISASRDDVALVIVGDGPQKQLLVDRAHDLADVHFTGEVVGPVGAYFAMADIFVLPGLGGLAINEAMAYGLPVICAEGDGTEQDLVIPNKTGLFFRRDDERDLADKIGALLAAPEKRQMMGQSAQNHVFTIASMSTMIDRFVRAVSPEQ
jgi:glycosyltransferase involved in cell wall biosynthesis